MSHDAISSSPVISLRGIGKQFPGVRANHRIDLDIFPGEIHAVLGENGAGKTTLMNILAGLYRPDEGRILFEGRPVRLRGPADAMALGIGMVHQHFTLIPSFTVAENIVLGLKRSFMMTGKVELEKAINAQAERFHVRVDAGAPVWQLSVGEQQRVEILKQLYRGARILILDEPTAVLAPQEVDTFFETLRSMVRDRRSVIFISHKLEEVTRLAGVVSVLRKGALVAHRLPVLGETPATLAAHMVGRQVELPVFTERAPPGSELVRIERLWVKGDRFTDALCGVDLTVRAGEILGIAGVSGNGQRELVEVMTGRRRATAGKIRLGELDITGASA
ncbi:ATP-binding cassette domain-containing protein, partial [bacterium]|nr:ATP-binding cassette domain-containing protein [candidate division CSSED10-310 bacterium]